MIVKARNIASLTGLRGVAAVWVVLFHICNGRAFRSGYLGVDIFFILSGFVLCHVYAERFSAKSVAAYPAFLKARVARIFPLHLFILTVVAAAALALPGYMASYPQPDERFATTCLFASMVLIQNWFHWLPTCWNAPAWTLSAEWFAYLTFPVFVFATQRWRPPTALILATLSIAAFAVFAAWKGIPSLDVTGTPGMMRMATEFTCGCLIFRAMKAGLAPLPIGANLFAIGLLVAALLWPGAIFLAIFSLFVIVLLAAQESGPVARLLSQRPIVFLGEISYSIYLVHWIMIQVSNWGLRTIHLSESAILAWDIALVVPILAISVVTYRHVELPARMWARKFGAGKDKSALADAI